MERSLSNVSVDGKTTMTSQRQRRPTRISLPEKKANDDEFMAAAIGDVEWLKHTFKGKKATRMNYDKNGLAAVHVSAIHGRLDCLKWLIDSFKVDVNSRSSDGWTPLHLCISNQTGRRSFDCLQYLLQRGADPSGTNDDGITPVHQASSEGHVQCLKALLEAGAKIDGRDCRGHSPIDLAKLWGHRTCARILAAEQWHQDKKYLVGELRHLRRMSMQQVMLDIEADVPKSKMIGWEFGDVTEKTGGKSLGKGKPAKGKVLVSPTGGSLMKPNSAGRPSGGQIRREEVVPPSREKSTVSAGSHLEGISEAHEGSSTCVPDDVIESQSEHPEGDPDLLYNPNMWNKSTKLPEKSYITNLKDHYPRDEYTMLPKFPPKRQDHAHGHQPELVRSPESRHVTPVHKPNWLKKPQSLSDPVLVMLAPPGKPSVYKPKHIGDVHKLKHYDPDTLPKTEVAMHLCSDVRSRLFNMALTTPVAPPLSSGASYWSESSSGQNDTEGVDVLLALRRLQQPTAVLPNEPRGLTI